MNTKAGPTFTVQHDLSNTPPAGTADPARGQGADIVRRRQAIHHQVEHEEAEEAVVRPENEQPLFNENTSTAFGAMFQGQGDEIPEVTEHLSSIEVELPGDIRVKFGPPPGVSLTMRIINLAGQRDLGMQASMMLRVLLSVQEVNGVPKIITNLLDAQKLANDLGDHALDLLSILFVQYWRTPSLQALRVVKKNPR